MAELRDLFEAKVDRTGEHHLWLGSRTKGGGGQIRVDGKLHTAARISWYLEHGEPTPDSRIRSCPDNPLCVRVEHLSITTNTTRTPAARAHRGSGSVTRLDRNKWKIVADAGRDATGKRRRLTRTVRGTKAQANEALAALKVSLAEGRTRPTPAGGSLTVGELIDWYIEFAREVRGLEHSTVFGYHDAYNKWLAGEIGSHNADRLSPADLDNAFGRMRRAGLSHSRMNNARAVLSGAYKWGRRHNKVAVNPVAGFELPVSSKAPKTTATPEVEELLRILDGADKHDSDIAPILKLAATTGMRRGELAGLRRDRVQLSRNELIVDTAVNDAGGTIVVKPTKTKQSRVVSLDVGTIEMLSTHLDRMSERATECGVEIPPDGFVFSLDPSCVEPMRPEFMTRRMRQLRTTLGIGSGDFDATILALRKWTSTELMDAGFNPSAVSERQGHTVQVMLTNYSGRRRSADKAAADHLGQRVHNR
ncbi:MAG: tyrosine-type recombinase/integrase [Acidimicrobiales bacterium]|nr:tyrosine-type recombinase/integrase [Acidimicrobiales bacterium]